MQAIDFLIKDWIGACETGEADLATLASLSIEVRSGPDRVPVTEVFDAVARTVRQHINVPMQPIAHWLLLNWWRLRWEPRRPTRDWSLAHSMASIGGGYAWPPLEFDSDSEFIHIQLEAEPTSDVAAIRFLRNVSLHIPAAHFERAVDQLVNEVQERLSVCRLSDREIEDVRLELAGERTDPELARQCRLQAIAGIDPGDAPKGWMDQASELGETTGRAAIDEIMAVLPELTDGLATAKARVDAIRTSPKTIDLSWVKSAPPTNDKPEFPWQKAARLAADLRRQLDLAVGPITNEDLEGRLGVTIPLEAEAGRTLTGGFRNGSAKDRTSILVPTKRVDNQRFYLARIIGCALLSHTDQHFLPVTNAGTAMQKFERAFAQEFLCPWPALDSFTDEHGMDDEGIAEAAEHFNVSELLVLSTLVNKNKLSRNRLEMM